MGIARSPASPAGAEPPSTADFALPRWFYWLGGISLIAALLFPYPAVKHLLIAIFGAIYLFFMFGAPERALLMFVIGMPAIILVPEDLIPLPGLNAETLAILSLGLAAFIARRQQPTPGPPNRFVAPLTYYAVVMTVSALLSFWAGTAENLESGMMRRLGPWEVFASVKNQVFFVLLAPIAFRLLWRPEYVRSAFRVAALGTALVSAHSLWQLRDHIVEGTVGGRNRAVGLMAVQPNLFGGFLAVMLVVLLPLILESTGRRRDRLLYVAASALASTALIYTFSRGAWLAALAGALCVGLLRGARAIVALFLLATVAMFLIPDAAVERAQSTFTTEDGSEQVVEQSAQTRILQWKMLPGMWLGSPLIGHGFKTFQNLWGEVGLEGRPRSAHSSIIEIAVEEGLLGIFAYGWLIWSIARPGLILRRRSGEAGIRALAVGVVAAALCLVALDASGTRFRNRGVTGYLWILAGGVARLAVEERGPTRKPGRPPRPVRHRGLRAAHGPDHRRDRPGKLSDPAVERRLPPRPRGPTRV